MVYVLCLLRTILRMETFEGKMETSCDVFIYGFKGGCTGIAYVPRALCLDKPVKMRPYS